MLCIPHISSVYTLMCDFHGLRTSVYHFWLFVVVYNATGPKIFSLKFLCFNFSMLLSFCCWSLKTIIEIMK